MQKLSENFYWIPDFDIFFRDLLKQACNSANKRSHDHPKRQSNSSCVFSLDGVTLKESPQLLAGHPSYFTGLKQNVLNNIKKSLVSVLDIHEDIFLVARIEKCLNGNSIHSSVQPYLIQMAASEATKTKSAIKLNKKMRQLFKTKLAAYRMPFAWAAK